MRIGIGNNKEGIPVYRCTEIIDVVETAKTYKVGKQTTNIGLKLKFGLQERVFRLEFISNAKLEPKEFEAWKKACNDHQIRVPDKDMVAKKAAEIKKSIDYEYSNADVDKIIEVKKKLSRNPKNYAMTKAR